MVARFEEKGRRKPNSKERTYDLEQFKNEAERVRPPWPGLSDEGIKLSRVDRVEKRSGLPEHLVKVGTWTMVGVMGAVTISAIATGSEKLLMTLLGLSAAFLTRLIFRGEGNDRSKTGERNHHSDDS